MTAETFRLNQRPGSDTIISRFHPLPLLSRCFSERYSQFQSDKYFLWQYVPSSALIISILHHKL